MWQKVTDDKDLEEYIEIGVKFWDVSYPKDYLKSGEVWVCKNGSGRIVSGFAIVKDIPLRTLEFFTPEMRRKAPVISKFDDSHFCEIAGYFVDPTISSKLEAIRYFSKVVEVVNNLRVPFVIWGFKANKGLERLYIEKCGGSMIYKGSKFAGNAQSNSNQTDVIIATISVTRMRMNLFIEKFRRMFTKKKRGVHQLYGEQRVEHSEDYRSTLLE